jgi:hypothetical protein
LRGNDFKGVEVLVRSLPTSLIELNLSHNDIGDEGVSVICDNLSYRIEEEAGVQNTTLTETTRLQTTAKRIEGLKSLNISSCSISCKNLVEIL